MSSKTKAHATKKKGEKPAASKVPARLNVTKPTAPLPRATVYVRHEGEMVERDARGFSLGELAAAAVPMHLTRSWDVSTDVRRRSVLEANTSSLKKWFAGTKKAEPSKPKPKPEPAEEHPKKRATKKKASTK